jgi:hypothetical protein
MAEVRMKMTQDFGVNHKFLGRAIVFIGCIGWGLGATLLSHFITGLLHA